MHRSRLLSRRPYPSYTLWLGALIAGLSLQSSAWCAQVSAQDNTPTAQQVAAHVQAFYDQTRVVEASFKQRYFFKLHKRYDRSKGKVIFDKKGRMRWDYHNDGKVIVSNGKKLKIYEPGEDSSPGQLIESPVNKNQLPIAFSFLMGQGKLRDQFKFRLLEEQKGFDGHLLELRPHKNTPLFKRVIFLVGKDKLRGVVRRVMLIDAAGNINRFDFSGLKFNRKIPNKRFSIQVPKRTVVIRPS